MLGRLKTHCGDSLISKAVISVFLLYFSNPPCLLADAPLHSCSVAGLPEREDGPFSLDLKLATLCCNPHQKIYSSLVLGV